MFWMLLKLKDFYIRLDPMRLYAYFFLISGTALLLLYLPEIVTLPILVGASLLFGTLVYPARQIFKSNAFVNNLMNNYWVDFIAINGFTFGIIIFFLGLLNVLDPLIFTAICALGIFYGDFSNIYFMDKLTHLCNSDTKYSRFERIFYTLFHALSYIVPLLMQVFVWNRLLTFNPAISITPTLISQATFTTMLHWMNIVNIAFYSVLVS